MDAYMIYPLSCALSSHTRSDRRSGIGEEQCQHVGQRSATQDPLCNLVCMNLASISPLTTSSLHAPSHRSLTCPATYMYVLYPSTSATSKEVLGGASKTPNSCYYPLSQPRLPLDGGRQPSSWLGVCTRDSEAGEDAERGRTTPKE